MHRRILDDLRLLKKMKIDRNQLSFSEAEELIALPRQLELYELSYELRNELWSIIYDDLRKSTIQGYVATVGSPWREVLERTHVKKLKQPLDSFNSDFSYWKNILKTFFMDAEYNFVFDIITFLIREKNFKSSVKEEIEQLFISHRASYRIIENYIIPISSELECKTFELALIDTRDDKFLGARSHLLKSGENLSLGKNADSIRESIHAVESVSRKISAQNTIADALKKIESRYKINPNLKAGFQNIYNYTSDQKGIRHSLIDDEESQVDETDAIFMLGACAAFVSYLIKKSSTFDR